ncbi:hypothetical protein PG995_012763 [Apiospora arundinis]
MPHLHGQASSIHATREVDSSDPLLIADSQCLSPVPWWGLGSLLTLYFDGLAWGISCLGTTTIVIAKFARDSIRLGHFLLPPRFGPG